MWKPGGNRNVLGREKRELNGKKRKTARRERLSGFPRGQQKGSCAGGGTRRFQENFRTEIWGKNASGLGQVGKWAPTHGGGGAEGGVANSARKKGSLQRW